ncbi:hypothetical protein YTPLAS18_15190 [Nitrospira sp.]|nr:hypothetical protein YTPLAS18_15190 [Nitrospira sp.]
MDEHNHWSSFVAGLLIGAGVAFLFAPQTGAQFRRSLRQYAADAKDELDDLAEKGMAAWDTAVEQGQAYAERGAEAVRETAKTTRRYAEEAAQRAR